jgi:hypothetical protein
MINKWWIGPDMEGSGHGLMTHYSGISLQENHEIPQPEKSVSRLKVESDTTD